ncbi:hypothetical protein NDU88_006557 [Pleurodeles waltl]|uniref:Uncharacterized protein n=1 Tax=Pleurodeles waltl TaxID=8319 RepID=A0AAV7LPF9_PLEWA|nr:hypothetical protein NDU88_006557 [Pleurodeles waltl]
MGRGRGVRAWGEACSRCRTPPDEDKPAGEPLPGIAVKERTRNDDTFQELAEFSTGAAVRGPCRDAWSPSRVPRGTWLRQVHDKLQPPPRLQFAVPGRFHPRGLRAGPFRSSARGEWRPLTASRRFWAWPRHVPCPPPVGAREKAHIVLRQGGAPRWATRGPGPPQVSARSLQPQARGSQRRRARARSWR